MRRAYIKPAMSFVSVRGTMKIMAASLNGSSTGTLPYEKTDPVGGTDADGKRNFWSGGAW